MKIHFLGAVDGVTGSRHLIDTGDRQVLLDCGLFQGWKLHRERNWQQPAALREVKIHGEMVPVRAEVRHLQGFSGHADRDGLLAWLRHLRRPPQHTYVVHGEPDAADALRVAIQNELGWAVRVPEYGEPAAI